MRKAKFILRMKRAIEWYIKGNYHCDKCPFCWGGEYCPGCDDYDDAGCYIRGDLYDACRLIPPVRFILGWGKRKKARYYDNHEYDDFGEFYEKEEANRAEFERLLSEWLNGYEIVWRGNDGENHPIDKRLHIQLEAWRIRDGYDEFAHPFQPKKSIASLWASVIKETCHRLVMVFKPYFCK